MPLVKVSTPSATATYTSPISRRAAQQQAATGRASLLKSAIDKSATENAAVATPAAVTTATPAAAASANNLRGAYADVFKQQTAQVNRQNALRSGAATRTAQEQAALSGFVQGSDQSQRLMERSQAGANTANLESQQDLLSTGSDLAKQQQAEDTQNAYKMLELYGKDSPALASSISGALLSGGDLSAAWKASLDENGNIKTMSEAEKAVATQEDYDELSKRLRAEGKTDTADWLDSTRAAEKATAAATLQSAKNSQVATAIRKDPASIKDYTDDEITQALQSDSGLATVLKSGAPDVSKGGDDMHNKAAQVKIGGILSYNGNPIKVLSAPTWTGSYNKSGYRVYAFQALDYATGDKLTMRS